VHRVPRDQVAEQVLHARVVGQLEQAGGQRAADRLRGDVGPHVGDQVAARVDGGRGERDAVRVRGQRAQTAREEVTGLERAHAGRDRRVGDDIVHHLGLRALEVHGHRGREDLDVADLLGGRGEQHVAVLLRAAVSEALEHVLGHHPQLAFGAADGLLEHPGEDGVRVVHPDRVRKLSVMEEHGAS
jgi:hypothetical protein